MTLVSRRKIGALLNVYMFLLWACFIAVMSFMSLSTSGIDSIAIAIPTFFISFGVYGFYNYFRNAPILRMDREKLVVQKRIYYWTDVKKIDFFKQHIRSSRDDEAQREGVNILFNDGRLITIYDQFYRNGDEIKLFIDQVINKQEYPNVTAIVPDIDPATETYIKIKGRVTRSFQIVFLCLGLLLFVRNCFIEDFSFGQTIGLLLLLSMFFQLHYFKISKNFIVIKKSFIPWPAKSYYLKNVREIIIDGSQGIEFVKIVTSDYHTKKFYALGISKEQWLTLEDYLSDYGIKVTNLKHGF